MSYEVAISDLEARWRPLDASEREVAQTLLVDAVVLIDAARPILDGLAVEGSMVQRVARMTVVEMVKRVLRNPDALTSQGVDSGAITQSFAGPSYDGELRLLTSDLEKLDVALATVTGESSGDLAANTITPRFRITPPFGDRSLRRI